MKHQLLLTASAAFLLVGCASRTEPLSESTAPRKERVATIMPGPGGRDVTGSVRSMPKSAAPVYCHLGSGAWHRVLSQSDEGVVIDTRRLGFDSVWKSSAKPAGVPKSRQRTVRWSDLEVPLPDDERDPSQPANPNSVV